MTRTAISPLLDELFEGRTFEVYSIAGDSPLTEPAPFGETMDALERIVETSGAGNGVDIRERK
ncbi:hypothetical protein LCGC14_1548400 [marine sediment metagenome]|uniref:Uncharacterized protein n=1 Tax=marine sediment metagenome TaxID=412755 RepID=A0A0F9IR19_9ZZZZ